MAVTNKQQESLRDKLAHETYTEVFKMLSEHKKCMLLRPTGFGKTFLLAHITKQFKKVLYLYPLDIIRLDVKTKYRKIVNTATNFASYRKVVSLYTQDKLRLIALVKEYDLVICDEAHMAGAKKTFEALKYIINECKDTNFLGATATPERSDGLDVTSELFDNRVISEYTLHNAIQDGLMQKPHYVYSLYEVVDTINAVEKEINKCKDSKRKKELLAQLNALEIEMGNLLNASEIIKQNINQLYKNINYMKFIVFFSEKATLYIKNGEVEKWFKAAFPDMQVRTLIITSDVEYAKNIHNLDGMKFQKNTIDIIYCIDMLNMGYHINDLTGVVMLRGTSSNIIYKQQVGRCLSVASENTPIIFDFVNNLFRKPYYISYSESNRNNVNSLDTNTTGTRLNALSERDFLINDKLASYQTIISKMLSGLATMKIEDAIYLYTNRSMPMKLVVKTTGILEHVIRKEFAKRGIVVED